MAREVEITREFIRSAWAHGGVTKQLRVIAQRIEKRADSLASADGVEMETWVKESTRPGGRPQAQVYSDNQSQEWGSSFGARYRIMGRAAEEGR